MLLIKRSIFTKILISLLPATMVPFLLSNYISYQMTGEAITDQLIELNQNSMAITASSIHTYLHELSLLGLAYYSDPALNRILSSKSTQTPAESVYVTQQFERIFAGYPEIVSVAYKSALTNKSFHVRSNYSSRISIPDFDPNDRTRLQDEPNSSFEVTDERRLRVNRYFIDIPTRTKIGLTAFEAQDTQLREITSALTTPDSSIFLFIRHDLQLLLAPPGTEDAELSWVDVLYEETLGKETLAKGAIHAPEGTYIYYRDVQYNLPVTLVKFVPQSIIDNARSTALGSSMVIELGAVFLVGIMAALISYIILQRVERILQYIQRLRRGDFKLAKPRRKKVPDELDILEERFYEMAVELDQLLNNQYRHQLELSRARLKMLQAQIHPHFFYNTLQYIGTLAIKNNAREVSDRLADLGAIFRYSMDIDTEEVYVKEELDHVAHYASLQMGRFKNKLTFSVSCPEEAYMMTIPKMILQPLVENSIVHGLEKGTGYGEVKLNIEMDDTELRIHVMDNGKGFTPEVIRAIRLRYENQNPMTSPAAEQRTGIGLTNILTRLQLYYGEAFDWDIQSEPYRLTTVTLRIPRIGGSDDEIADRR